MRTGPALETSDARIPRNGSWDRYTPSIVRRFAIVFLIACHQSPLAPDAFSGLCSDQIAAAPTYTNMQELFRTNCIVCHTSGVELDLAPTVGYANLVGRTPPNYANPMTDESCGATLVVPGDPDTSYLYRKLTLATPCAGSPMPIGELGASYALQPCELQLVHDWITAGAQDN